MAPTIPEIREANRILTFAAKIKDSSEKASSFINSDMVKPMPPKKAVP